MPTLHELSYGHLIAFPLIFALLIALAVIYDRRKKGLLDRPSGRKDKRG